MIPGFRLYQHGVKLVARRSMAIWVRSLLGRPCEPLGEQRRGLLAVGCPRSRPPPLLGLVIEIARGLYGQMGQCFVTLVATSREPLKGFVGARPRHIQHERRERVSSRDMRGALSD